MNMETVKKPGKWAKNMGLMGLSLCALCCLLPILGIVGGTGLLAMLSFYAEKIAMILLIISGGLFAFWLYKKNQPPPSCSIDCSCKPENTKSNEVL